MSTGAERVRNLTDFQGSDYLRFPLPHEERVKHLESWLREALVLPFSYNGAIDAEGNFVSFGQKMVEINERAVEARIGQVGEARVRAEMEGVVRLEKVFNEAKVGDVVFLFSPPGSREEGFGVDNQRRLSFTYIFEITEGSGTDKKSIRAIAIPAPEISPHTHVKQFSDIFADIGMVALTTLSETKLDRKLVSTPFLVSGMSEGTKTRNLDAYTQAFVGKNWGEIEKSIKDGLKLQEDEYAEERRKSLIHTISWQIRRYVDERDGARLNNIGEAARIVMAREASGHYPDMIPKLFLEEYNKTEGAMWMQLQYKLADRKEKDILFSKYGAQLVISKIHLNEVRDAILRDPNAKAMLTGSSCGGGGIDETLESSNGKFGQFGGGRGHILESLMDSIKDSATEYSSSSEMKCVTCPFCSQLVDAIVTSDKIVCPSCHKSASRG